MNSDMLILIVDDEPDNVTLLHKRLSSQGYKTLLAYNGEEAIRLARDELPDLILLDLMMPGLSGYDVARILKIGPETADIPYIFLTAKSEVSNRVNGLEMGASDYIIKPFHFKELMARIGNILKHTNRLASLKEENMKLQQLSMVDDLTGLYNKRYFLERLDEELNRASRYNYSLACLMMDIDYFKKINDSYGHLIGDKILTSLAGIIRNSTRVVDVVARFGGEEFIVLLPQTSREGGINTAEKIRLNIQKYHFLKPEYNITLTISIGVSYFGGERSIIAVELLHQADLALYAAKNNGRNNTSVY